MNLKQVRNEALLFAAVCFVTLAGLPVTLHCVAQEQDGQATNPGSPSPASPAANNESAIRVYKVGDGVTNPKLIHWVDPVYPRAVSEKHIQGFCVVALVVDDKGMPQDVWVARKSGNKELDASALKAVQKYRFEPSTFQGKPVAVTIKVDVNFR